MRSLFTFFIIALSFSLGRAADPLTLDTPAAATVPAPLTRDLGRNLAYHRVRSLPADLPDAMRKQPRVLDLRYVRADDTAAAALHAWLKANASSRTPIFVLANASTDRELVAPLLGRGAVASVLLIGAEGRNFTPDIPVQISAEDERRAYDALEAGIELSLLLTDNPNKVRNDEASLSRDRSSDPSPSATTAEAAKDASAPPIDAALQRAVHLHRTLLALRKL